MKKRILGFLSCLLLIGCYDLLGFECHGSLDVPSPPDPTTFRVTNKLRIGFYEDASHGWEADMPALSRDIDQYFMDALNCSAEKLHAKIYLKVQGALPIDGIDLASGESMSTEYITELEAGKNSSPVRIGVLPSDFRIILTDPFVCIEGDANGFTANYGEHLFVWANSYYPDLFRHEFLHVLDAVLGLTDEQEESLYPCAPRAPHGSD